RRWAADPPREPRGRGPRGRRPERRAPVRAARQERPRLGGRTGAPRGDGTSRGGDVSNLFGRGQPGAYTNPLSGVRKLPEPRLQRTGTVVRSPRAWAGT